MKYIVIVLLAVLIISNYDKVTAAINNKAAQTTELVAVAVIYRHGDRSPFISYPNDQFYNLSYWPMGFGQLTLQGIQRHYKLGQWFRQRYKTFLNTLYSPEEIYVQSTNTDRCLMSAAANLAGMYPPQNVQIWNNQLNWQPLPVHVAYETNIMEQPCPKYDKLYNQVKEVIYKDFEKRYPDIFKYIAEHTGWPNVSIYEVSTLRSVMYAYKNYNTSFIPQWTKKLDQKILDHIAGVRYSIATSNGELTKLRVGTFYYYIFNHFNKFTNSSITNSPPKFMMMSSHDTTITSILHGMGLYKMRPVGFGDTFIMELRKRSDGNYFMNLLYKLKDNLERLVVSGCEFDCDYNKLKMSLKDVTIDIATRKEACAIKEAINIQDVAPFYCHLPKHDVYCQLAQNYAGDRCPKMPFWYTEC